MSIANLKGGGTPGLVLHPATKTPAGGPLHLFVVEMDPSSAVCSRMVAQSMDDMVLIDRVKVGTAAQEEGAASVESMARACVALILEVCETGPYHLVGAAGAGFVAYEMAYQLIGKDEDVLFLGLAEPPMPQLNAASRHYAMPPIGLPITLLAPPEDRNTFVERWTETLPKGAQIQIFPYSRTDPFSAEEPGEKLVHAVRECKVHGLRRERNYSPCLSIQLGARRTPPLFCIPGAGASVTVFVQLAQALGSQIPIHGLQPRGLCGELVPHSDVASAARQYVGALLKAAPEGPFHLLGHSFGGWVAREMAHQLDRIGRPPSFLFILDSESPTGPEGRACHHTRAEALAHLVELHNMQAGCSIPLGVDDFAPLSPEEQLSLLLRELVGAKVLPPRTNADALRGSVRVFHSNLNTSYTPAEVYRGQLQLALARDDDGLRGAHQTFEAWKRQAPAAQLWQSSGNHQTMLTGSHVEALAAWMTPLLRDAAS